VDSEELEWIAWTHPITTAFGATIATSDLSDASQIEQLPDGAILMNVGHSNREVDVDWLNEHPHSGVRRHLERYEVNGRRVYLLNSGSLVNLAAGLGTGAPQLFDPFAAIMLLGLDTILQGQTRELSPGVQRYPTELETRVARALVDSQR
jgi:adenosylhomocysteinase